MNISDSGSLHSPLVGTDVELLEQWNEHPADPGFDSKDREKISFSPGPGKMFEMLESSLSKTKCDGDTAEKLQKSTGTKKPPLSTKHSSTTEEREINTEPADDASLLGLETFAPLKDGSTALANSSPLRRVKSRPLTQSLTDSSHSIDSIRDSIHVAVARSRRSLTTEGSPKSFSSTGACSSASLMPSPFIGEEISVPLKEGSLEGNTNYEPPSRRIRSRSFPRTMAESSHTVDSIQIEKSRRSHLTDASSNWEETNSFDDGYLLGEERFVSLKEGPSDRGRMMQSRRVRSRSSRPRLMSDSSHSIDSIQDSIVVERRRRAHIVEKSETPVNTEVADATSSDDSYLLGEETFVSLKEEASDRARMLQSRRVRSQSRPQLMPESSHSIDSIQDSIALERRRRSHIVDNVHKSCTNSSSQSEVDSQVPLNDFFSGDIEPIAARQAMTESSHSIDSIQDSVHLEWKRRSRVALPTSLAQIDDLEESDDEDETPEFFDESPPPESVSRNPVDEQQEESQSPRRSGRSRSRSPGRRKDHLQSRKCKSLPRRLMARAVGNDMLDAKPRRRRSRSPARPSGDATEKMSRSWPKELDHKGSEETPPDEDRLAEVKVLLENVKKATNSTSNADSFQIQEVAFPDGVDNLLQKAKPVPEGLCDLQWSKASAHTISSSSIDDGDDEHDDISVSSDNSDSSLEEMSEEIWKRRPLGSDLPRVGPPHRSRSLSPLPQRQKRQEEAARISLPCTPIQTNRKKLSFQATKLKDSGPQTASVSSASADMLHISNLDLFLELNREDDAKSEETSMNARDLLILLDQSSQMDIFAQSSVSSNENEEDAPREDKEQLMTPQELINYLRDHNHKDLPESSYYQDATAAKYQSSSTKDQHVMTAEEMADILKHVASHHESNAEIRWDVIARMAFGFEDDPLKPMEYVFQQDDVVDIDDTASLSSISVECANDTADFWNSGGSFQWVDSESEE